MCERSVLARSLLWHGLPTVPRVRPKVYSVVARPSVVARSPDRATGSTEGLLCCGTVSLCCGTVSRPCHGFDRRSPLLPLLWHGLPTVPRVDRRCGTVSRPCHGFDRRSPLLTPVVARSPDRATG